LSKCLPPQVSSEGSPGGGARARAGAAQGILRKACS